MYVNPNFKTKKALKEAVAAWTATQVGLSPSIIADPSPTSTPSPRAVTVFSPGPFPATQNGTTSVEGPHYPQPHRWYKNVLVKDGVVVKVIN